MLTDTSLIPSCEPANLTISNQDVLECTSWQLTTYSEIKTDVMPPSSALTYADMYEIWGLMLGVAAVAFSFKMLAKTIWSKS